MSLALIYWVAMLIWVVLGFWSAWPISGSNARPAAGNVLLFVLLLAIGWATFGPPVKT